MYHVQSCFVLISKILIIIHYNQLFKNIPPKISKSRKNGKNVELYPPMFNTDRHRCIQGNCTANEQLQSVQLRCTGQESKRYSKSKSLRSCYVIREIKSSMVSHVHIKISDIIGSMEQFKALIYFSSTCQKARHVNMSIIQTTFKKSRKYSDNAR